MGTLISKYRHGAENMVDPGYSGEQTYSEPFAQALHTSEYTFKVNV